MTGEQGNGHIKSMFEEIGSDYDATSMMRSAYLFFEFLHFAMKLPCAKFEATNECISKNFQICF